MALQGGEGRAGQQLDLLVEKTHAHALLGAALAGRGDAGAQGARLAGPFGGLDHLAPDAGQVAQLGTALAQVDFAGHILHQKDAVADDQVMLRQVVRPVAAASFAHP
ncbi:hypothetical protein D3C80_1265450 [compost metagenome]